MEPKKIYLSSNLKYLRISNHYTQEEVAAACNKKNTAISNWEKGIREPDAVDLAILSNFFNVSVDDLMKKDLRLKYDEITKKSKFHYKDEESGLSVELIPPEGVDWDKLSEDERKEYINQAMDFLYETKRDMKKDK